MAVWWTVLIFFSNRKITTIWTNSLFCKVCILCQYKMLVILIPSIILHQFTRVLKINISQTLHKQKKVTCFLFFSGLCICSVFMFVWSLIATSFNKNPSSFIKAFFAWLFENDIYFEIFENLFFALRNSSYERIVWILKLKKNSIK